MKKATVITILFIFFLCSTFSFCYATSSQTPEKSLKGTLIADKGERHEKIEALREKIRQLKEDKEKIEKEIQENEKELRHLLRHRKS